MADISATSVNSARQLIRVFTRSTVGGMQADVPPIPPRAGAHAAASPSIPPTGPRVSPIHDTDHDDDDRSHVSDISFRPISPPQVTMVGNQSLPDVKQSDAYYDELDVGALADNRIE